MPDKKKEILANVERLHQYMDRYGCSAIAVRSGVNFTYLSGVYFPGTLGRHLDFVDTPREVYLVWPREGEPVIITHQAAVPIIERDSWVSEMELCQDYVDTGIAKTAEVLKKIGLDKSKLGFEKTCISAARWEDLEHSLPDAQIFDCTEMMNEVRWIKTPGEVELLKQAADIQDEAFLEVFSGVREGDTEAQVHSRMLKSCLDHGAQYAHGILNSSRNPTIYCGEGGTVLRKGDVIRTDYVSYYRGYPGHQSRQFVLGQPSDDLKRTYEKYRDVYLKTIARCRPGIKANELHRFARELFLEYGFPHKPGAMVGHSVGPWFHQQVPILVSTDERVIEEGMVIALEPFVDPWHLQDMFLVTEDGAQLLSDRFNTENLFVID
ncbi:MAG: M24 family metallopeptidase [Dehalococcoidia bacterium]